MPCTFSQRLKSSGDFCPKHMYMCSVHTSTTFRGTIITESGRRARSQGGCNWSIEKYQSRPWQSLFGKRYGPAARCKATSAMMVVHSAFLSWTISRCDGQSRLRLNSCRGISARLRLLGGEIEDTMTPRTAPPDVNY